MVRMVDRVVISLVLVLGLLWPQFCVMALRADCAEARTPKAGPVQQCKSACPNSEPERFCPAPCNLQHEVPAIPDPVRPQPLSPAPMGVTDWAVSAVPSPGTPEEHPRVYARQTGPPARARLCVWNI